MVRQSGADSSAYKRNARDTWRRAAPAWHEWIGFISEWVSPATELMLDLARIQEGSRVLDIAAGDADQSLKAARRVGKTGYVLATDLTPRFVSFAAAAANEAGFSNVESRVMDAEDLDLEDDSFDASICRLGLMFLPDKVRGLSEVRRVLKPGGCMAAIVFSVPERNPYLSIPISIIRRRLNTSDPAPGEPGVFSLAAPELITGAFAAAGFQNIETHRVATELRFKSAEVCVRFERYVKGGSRRNLERDRPGSARARKP
ncbi:MAG: class I SAM-dependent methyltransferase [Candidatus Zixiibacteriota bacterium]